MGNILDLKKPSTGVAASEPTSDGVAFPPSSASEPEHISELSEATEYLRSLQGAPVVEETAWKMSTKPDELERRKEHALLGTLGAIGIGVAIWSGSFALVGIVALTVLAWEVHHRTVHEADVHMGVRGVTVNGHRHTYDKLKSFHIQQLPDDTWHLSIKPAGRMRPDMRLPLGDHDHEEVRAVLSQYIVEEEHPIPISEIFLKS